MYDRLLVPDVGGEMSMGARAVAERLAARWAAEVSVLGHDPDELFERYRSSPNALIVMSSPARSRVPGGRTNLADTVLQRVEDPVLLIGPKFAISSDWPSGPVLICSDQTPLSEQIVWPAARWAKALGVEPRLITVTDKTPTLASVDASTAASTMGQLTSMVESVVGRAVNYDLLHGNDPARIIADQAQWQHASLIAMATHGRSGLSRMTMGSIAMSVLHRATCPVLVEKPTLESGGDGEERGP